MHYLDSHCHIYDEAFDLDREEMLQKMVYADVREAMIVCCRPEELEKAYQIHHPDLSFIYAVGIHPEDAKQADQLFPFETLKELSMDKRIKAVGEIGLDYYWNDDNKSQQQALFRKQIEWAKSIHKPIIVHSRDAAQDTFDILKENVVPGVIHSFSGSPEMAREYEKRGYYISFGGPVTFKNAHVPKEAVKAVSLDHLLVETDSPYLTPTPFRGKRNDPSYIPYIVETIAELKGVSVPVLMQAIYQNYYRLFEGEEK